MDALLTKRKPSVEAEKTPGQPIKKISGSEALLRCLVEEGACHGEKTSITEKPSLWNERNKSHP
jgi:hypothetical protein